MTDASLVGDPWFYGEWCHACDLSVSQPGRRHVVNRARAPPRRLSPQQPSLESASRVARPLDLARRDGPHAHPPPVACNLSPTNQGEPNAMSFGINVSGHIEDDAQVDAAMDTVRQAAAQLVDTLQTAGIPLSGASASIQKAGGSSEYVNLLGTAANANPSEQGADGDTGTPPATS